MDWSISNKISSDVNDKEKKCLWGFGDGILVYTPRLELWPANHDQPI